MQKRSWRRLRKKKLIALGLLCVLSMSACGSVHNKYYCPPQLAYDQTGKIDVDHYRVNADCFDSMTEKVSACYEDAKE